MDLGFQDDEFLDISVSFQRLIQLSNHLDYRTKWTKISSKILLNQRISLLLKLSVYERSIRLIKKIIQRRFFIRWKRRAQWAQLARKLLFKCRVLCVSKFKKLLDKRKREIMRIPWRKMLEILLKRKHENDLIRDFAYLQTVRKSKKFLKKSLQTKFHNILKFSKF